MDFDKLFLTKLLTVSVGDFPRVTTKVKPDFMSGLYRPTYEFVLGHFDTYKVIPSTSVVESFSRLKLDEVPTEPIQFYIDAIVQRMLLGQLQLGVDEMRIGVEKGETDAVVSKMEEIAFNIRKHIAIDERAISIYDKIDDVLDYYDKVKKGIIVGVETPWETMTKHLLGFQKGDFIMFAARPGLGKCIHEDAIVYCPNGDRITFGQFVREKRKRILTFDEENQKFVVSKVDGWVDSGRKPVYKVTTRSGRSTKVTGCHPFLHENGQWVKIDGGLKVGDRIVVPRSYNYDLPDNKYFDSIEELEMLALLIAEGGLSSGSIKFSTADSFILDKAEKYVEKYGLYINKESKYDYALSMCRRKNNPLVRLLKQTGLWRHKSVDKFIPDQVFKCSNRQLVPFIEMLFNTDGSAYICKNGLGAIEYCSASKELIDGLNSLMMRFGIFGMKRFKDNDCAGAWLYTLYGEEVDHFYSLFKLMPRKQRILEKIIGKKRNTNVLVTKLSKEDVKRLEPKVRKFGVVKFAKEVFGWTNQNVCFSKLLRTDGKKALSLFKLRQIGEALKEDWLINKSRECIFDEIASIEYVGKGQVYDISVKGTHNFVVDDMLVHNTAILLLLANHAFGEGAKCLFVSPEMSQRNLLMRLSSYQLSLPYGDFRRGKLNSFQEKILKDHFDTMRKEDKFLVMGKGMRADLSVIRSVIFEKDPDIVFLDGLYMIDPLSKKYQDRYEKMGAVANDIKRIAVETEKPIVASMQFNRSVSEKKISGAFLENLGLSDVLGWNIDMGYALLQDDDLYIDSRMIIHNFKMREFDPLPDLLVNWNYATMDFSEIGYLKQAGKLATLIRTSGIPGGFVTSSGGPSFGTPVSGLAGEAEAEPGMEVPF